MEPRANMIDNIYKYLEDNQIILVNKSIDGTKGAFIRYKDLKIIAVEPSLTENEKIKVIKHELGHYLASATYSVNETDIQKIKKMEQLANEVSNTL